MGGRGAFYFSGGNPSPAEKIDVFGFSSGMAVSPSKERYALSGSLIGEGGGTSPARGMMRIRSPIPILLTGRVGGPFGAPIAASVGKAACRRIADIIDVLFHPTISRAASRTASGSLSCPRGFTPTIGFPEATARSQTVSIRCGRSTCRRELQHSGPWKSYLQVHEEGFEMSVAIGLVAAGDHALER